MPMRFHWRLLQGGERGVSSRSLGATSAATGLPDLEHQIAQCRTAEQLGIDGMLVDVGIDNPDPILLCTAIGMATQRIGMIVAMRSGMIHPTIFTQQINTLSALIGGDRILLNIVAGDSPTEQRIYGDDQDHDQRYARTEEFLAICRGFWQGTGPFDYRGRFYRVEQARLNTPYRGEHRDHPLMFVAGGSEPCRALSISQGSCWMTLADAPDEIAGKAKPIVTAGKEVGIRVSIITRPTRDEALDAARSLVADQDPSRVEKQTEADFVGGSDSVSIRAHYALAEREWLTRTLWMGAVRSHGAAAVCLVGSYDEVAAALMDYRRIGVTHFILSGWPKRDEMVRFGSEVIPRVRSLEASASS